MRDGAAMYFLAVALYGVALWAVGWTLKRRAMRKRALARAIPTQPKPA